nr:hypothetical protein CFP56_46640 [Quercus suber]
MDAMVRLLPKSMNCKCHQCPWLCWDGCRPHHNSAYIESKVSGLNHPGLRAFSGIPVLDSEAESPTAE